MFFTPSSMPFKPWLPYLVLKFARQWNNDNSFVNPYVLDSDYGVCLAWLPLLLGTLSQFGELSYFDPEKWLFKTNKRPSRVTVRVAGTTFFKVSQR